MEAAKNILNENEAAGIVSWTEIGQGGAVLTEHTTRYNASGSKAFKTWVNSQESGQQSGTQATAAGFKAAAKAHFIAVAAGSPLAKHTYETPNSFNSVAADRVWDGAYEVALREAVAEVFAENGIIVYLAETNATIEDLESFDEGGITVIPYDVFYQAVDARGPSAHYTPLGNFAVALSLLVRLGRDIRTFTFNTITDVTADHKTAAVICAWRNRLAP